LWVSPFTRLTAAAFEVVAAPRGAGRIDISQASAQDRDNRTYGSKVAEGLTIVVNLRLSRIFVTTTQNFLYSCGNGNIAFRVLCFATRDVDIADEGIAGLVPT